MNYRLSQKLRQKFRSVGSTSYRRQDGLNFDTLESRNLLAGISFDAATGIVTVNGSGIADSVQVDWASGTEISVDYQNVESRIFNLSEVTEVVFLGYFGDDIFENLTSANSRAYGHAGDDYFVGGEGVDQFFGGLGSDQLFGNSGNDTLHGDQGIDQIFAGAGDDLLVGGRGSDMLSGQSGNDYIIGGADVDHADGGDGDDRIFGGHGDDVLDGGAGEDLIVGESGNDVITGGDDDDQLLGGDGRDRMFGELGDDFLDGLNGNDRLQGGPGNDVVYGGQQNDFVRGGEGDDRLFGQEGSDTVDGQAGNDIVHGGPGSDVLIGGLGDDDIYGDEEDVIHSDSEDDVDLDDFDFSRPFGLSNRLTISFAPDGTSIFGQSSEFFSTFNRQFGGRQPRNAILDGFTTWAQYGNLDVGFVGDSGDDFGVAGPSYGDPRFGDVRIGAIPLPSDVFAVALGQHEFVSGTWAGDILFNSNVTFNDLDHFRAVALHEIGHVLGLDHSEDPDSAMHRFSIRTDLSPADIAAFQELYGLRALDGEDSDPLLNNDSLEESTHIDFYDDDDVEPGTYPSVLFGDIGDSEDIDYFRVDAPDDYLGQITFRIISDEISLLAPSVSLLTSNGTLISQFDSTSQTGDEITVSVSALGSDGRFFVAVEGATDETFGSYALITTLDDTNIISTEMIGEVARAREFTQFDQEEIAEYFVDPEDFLFNDDVHQDDDFGTATELDTEEGYEAFSRYFYRASLSDNLDVDRYLFRSIESELSDPVIMNISVRALEMGGLVPKAILYDRDANEVSSNILVNGHGEYVIQAENISPDTEYFLSVESDDLLAFDSGSYELTISFSEQPVELQSWVQGTLDSGTPQYHSLHVAESQIIQFAFEAEPLAGSIDALIWATVYDQDGEIVYQSATRSGERRTGNTVFFGPGSYTIEIENGLGFDFSGLEYQLFGIDVGGSQGPKLSDPSDSPFERNKEGQYIYPDDVVTDHNFVFTDGISSNQPQPPADSPPGNLYGWYWGLGI